MTGVMSAVQYRTDTIRIQHSSLLSNDRRAPEGKNSLYIFIIIQYFMVRSSFHFYSRESIYI